MEAEAKRRLIEHYLAAYNAFDLEGIMSVIHPDIEFKNISGGQVNATAAGEKEFRQLAEQSKSLFSSRKQTITGFTSNGCSPCLNKVIV